MRFAHVFVCGVLSGVLLLAGAATASEPASDLLAIVREGDTPRLAAMLDAGARPDVRDAEYLDATALMLAAERDDTAVARLLLAAGADPDAADRNGDTALNWAAYYGHTATVLLLLEAGADPSLTGHGNALEIARRRGFEALLEPLATRLGEVRPVPEDNQAVIDAVLGTDAETLQRMLSADARLAGTRDRFDRPVLMLAAASGSTAVMAALLEAGANVDAVDPIGFTPLMLAAREAHASAVRALLEAGADPRRRATPSGLLMTPLHLAAVGGDREVCELLRAAGSDLNARGAAGNVPMMWAMAEGHLDLVTTFLAWGADPDLANDDGDSIRSVARKWKIGALLEALGE